KLMLGYNTIFGMYNAYANSPVDVAPRDYNETYWGVAGYAKYLFNDIFSLAGRAEYMHCDDGAKFGAAGSALSATNLSGRNAEAYGFTTTAGFNLWENMQLRCEYRVDFTNVADVNTNTANGTFMATHLAIAEVVYSF
ncbi:MAG: outer membrane beta-barrel protein, partial [Verrucomicrobiota bacterium]